MAEKQENIEQKAPQPASTGKTPPTGEALAGTEKLTQNKAADEKPFVSKGWKIHNAITYKGVDWIVNSTLGASFAFWSARTEMGQKRFQQPVTNFFKAVLTPILKSPGAREEGAKWGTMFAGIMVGGFAIIPVMMGLENKKVKKKMVKAIDESIYGADVVANEPKFAESYERIDQEPKKDFMTGLGSRFLSLAPLIAVTTIPASNKWLIKYVYDPVGKASKGIMNLVGIKGEKMMAKGAMEHIAGDPNLPKEFVSDWNFLHRTIGFDFGMTFFYAILHEMSYKSLAHRQQKKQQEQCAELVAEARQDAQDVAKAHAVTIAAEERRFTQNIKPRDRMETPAELYSQKVADTDPSLAMQRM